MIVNRGTPSSTGGAKCISLLNEISMSQLTASAEDARERAALRHVRVQRIDGPSCRLDHSDKQMVLEVVPDRKVDHDVDVVVTQVLCRTDAREHQQSW